MAISKKSIKKPAPKAKLTISKDVKVPGKKAVKDSGSKKNLPTEKKPKLTRGVLLMAIGHPDYMRQAINLAASIKLNEPGCRITLVYSASTMKAMRPEYESLFEHKIEAPFESYNTMVDGGYEQEFIKIKTRMYDLSPYDETLFLDVDMVWLKGRTVSELIDTVPENIDWLISNTGHFLMNKTSIFSQWADVAEVKKAYNLTDQRWYNYHSECTFFRKSKAVAKYYDMVKDVYDNPKMELYGRGTDGRIKQKVHNFGGARMADELAFQIASMVLGYYPAIENWLPVFWYHREKARMYDDASVIANDFYGYSVGGNQHHEYIRKQYNRQVNYVFMKMGFQTPFNMNQHNEKKKTIPGRNGSI